MPLALPAQDQKRLTASECKARRCHNALYQLLVVLLDEHVSSIRLPAEYCHYLDPNSMVNHVVLFDSSEGRWALCLVLLFTSSSRGPGIYD